jgi:uncharacterized Tic20 family protein
MEDITPYGIPEKKATFRPWNMDLNTFLMCMHLSQFASMIIPMAGWILPIVMWSQFKDENEEINKNGKQVLNFMLTFVIYIVIMIVLYLVGFVLLITMAEEKNGGGLYSNAYVPMLLFVVWFILLMVLVMGHTILIILAAIKANKGGIGTYPLTFKFFKS